MMYMYYDTIYTEYLAEALKKVHGSRALESIKLQQRDHTTQIQIIHKRKLYAEQQQAQVGNDVPHVLLIKYAQRGTINYMTSLHA